MDPSQQQPQQNNQQVTPPAASQPTVPPPNAPAPTPPSQSQPSPAPQVPTQSPPQVVPPVGPPPTAPPQSFASPQQPVQAPQQNVPVFNAPQPSGSNHKKVFAALAAAIVLGLGLVIVLMNNVKETGPSNSSATSSAEDSQDVIDRNDGTLDLSSTVDKNETLKTQTLRANVGQQVNLSDGTSLLVKKYTLGAESLASDEFYTGKPKDGNQLVLVEVVVGNREEDGISRSFSRFDFGLTDAAGNSYDGVATKASIFGEDDVRVKGGEQATAFIGFEVPKSATGFAFVHEAEYRSLGDSTEPNRTVRAEITLN